MARHPTLDELQRRPYVAEIHRRDGHYVLVVPELGLAARHPDLAEAYQEIERRKDEVFAHYSELGLSDRLSLPQGQKLRRELTPFLIKAAAVAFVGAFLFVTASVSFTYALREPLRHAAQRTARAALNQTITGLKEFAARDLNAQREAELVAAIREAVPRLRPYADELRPLFEGAR